MPSDPRQEGVHLEIWCDLMKKELKIARELLAGLRKEGVNERHWLYAQYCLEECSSSLDIISGVIPKNTVLLKFARYKE
jgi:hypothetical protein